MKCLNGLVKTGTLPRQHHLHLPAPSPSPQQTSNTTSVLLHMSFIFRIEFLLLAVFVSLVFASRLSPSQFSSVDVCMWIVNHSFRLFNNKEKYPSKTEDFWFRQLIFIPNEFQWILSHIHALVCSFDILSEWKF